MRTSVQGKNLTLKFLVSKCSWTQLMPSASVVTLVLGIIHHPPALSRTSSFVNMWIGCATPTLTDTKTQQDDDDGERMRMRS
jgi:hypothetical protein